ncbi:MAG: DoxX family protein [Marivirga sp.]|nr:DoxX family protein [Marivirga sp.]
METLNIYQTTRSLSKKMLWTGYTISGICILFLLVDSIMKVVMNPMHVEGSTRLGWSVQAVQPIGIVLLLCTILYIVPRTAIIGAIMLTGYLGGAIATMARIGEFFYFPLLFGILLWIGLYLRSEKFRSFLSLKN